MKLGVGQELYSVFILKVLGIKKLVKVRIFLGVGTVLGRVVSVKYLVKKSVDLIQFILDGGIGLVPA